MKDINQLKYNMLTLSNTLRGYSNVNAIDDVTRVECELEKLETLYSDHIINDDIKDEYIISELNKLVWTVDDNELAELLEERPDDSYYNDASMNWIYDYVYNLFDNDETLEDIDITLATFFGHYSSNHIVKNGDQFYILFEW